MALLIDAENISEKYIGYILDELASESIKIIVRRIYGDWSSTSLTKWRDSVGTYALNPMQQFNNIKNKNSSDSAMIIDAMDILYDNKVDGFCLVSSDSDFTRLAMRIRESGKYVIGMGEKKTPSIFKTACNKFVNLEVLLPLKEDVKTPNPLQGEAIHKVPTDEEMAILNKIYEIANANADDDGWANLADVGNLLVKQITDFDPRNFGCKTLSKFVKNFDEYIEMKQVQSINMTSIHYYIRFKRK